MADTTSKTTRGRRGARTANRGRQVKPEALIAVRELLGDEPRARDLLIEHLHKIQDTHGHIRAAHLAALAHEMRIPMAEAYEVATFYAHFDVIDDDESAPPAVTIRVCDSLSCALAGAAALHRALEDGTDAAAVRVVRAPCMGRCESAPIAQVGQRHLPRASAETVLRRLKGGDLEPEPIDYPHLAAYRDGGGYRLYEACRRGERQVEDITTALVDSGLRGLGGAGFPTGQKWEIVRAESGPRYLTVNGDEGEPGTFKDRVYLERDPHRFLEGVLIAAWAIDAEAVYIYLRDEYPGLHLVLAREIGALEAANVVPGGFLRLRRGAGSYICGEESAMIESIEGKRGYPRQRPPYVAAVGLFDRPTLVNNIETLYWVREIIERGPAWFIAQGRNGSRGWRSYSVSGRVAKPGVHLAPAGITLRELINEYSGGMAPGHQLKAYLPGGASGGILPASLDDVPLDFGTLEEHGCFIGSAAVIVLSDQDDVAAAALNLLRFFAEESCGQCTPCRVGTEKMVKLLEAGTWDRALLEDLSLVMRDASICGLGQAAPNPIQSVLRHFADDVTSEHS